jgi:hypothetical protein
MKPQSLASLMLALMVSLPTVARADNLPLQTSSIEIQHDRATRMHRKTEQPIVVVPTRRPLPPRQRISIQRMPRWLHNLLDWLQQSPSQTQSVQRKSVQRIHCSRGSHHRQQITQITRSGQTTVQSRVSTTCS